MGNKCFVYRVVFAKAPSMSEMILSGQIHLIEPTRAYGQKGFRKRLVVLQQARGKMVNFIPLDFLGDLCDAANSLHVGDSIRVTGRLTGRRWQRDPSSEVRFFLSVEAIGFEYADPQRAGSPAVVAESPVHAYSDSDDDNSPPF
jgi:single-stranded DNA-binding protein